MENLKPISTPVEKKLKLTKESEGKMVDATQYKSLIGSLRYLTATRLDIVHGVGLLRRFIDEPLVCHLQGAKRILCYIKGTITDGIFYTSNKDVKLVGYIDSDSMAGDVGTQKSTSNIMVFKKITNCCTLNSRSRIYSNNQLCYAYSLAKKNSINGAPKP
ncbi:hypothetical protein CR513_51608, partial [Mucuna pruriens]